MLTGAMLATGPMPVPLPVSGTVWGLPAASSVTLMLALLAPVEVGANVTPKLQLPLTGTEVIVRQSVPVAGAARANSPGLVPVSVMLEMFSVAVPVLLNCTLNIALVVPTRWLPKGTFAGLSTTLEAVPVAESDRLCGLPGALWATLRLALLAPVDAGWNFSPTLQLAPAARVVWVRQSVPIVGTARTKSLALVPVNAMLVNVSGPVPALLNCTFDTALALPTATLPKARLAGLNMTVGAVRWKTVVPPTPLKSEIIKK